jgi:uncharacterized protein YbjT (DUF2867 family)
MSENKTALIAGATGLVGSSLLRQLLKENYYHKIIVLVRKNIDTKDSRVVQQVVDYNKLTQYANEMRADDVYCTLGTTIKKAGSQEAFKKVDYEYPLALGKIAKQNGAQKFIIVTALGSDAKSPIFYNKVKGEIEDQLKSLKLPHLFILQPSLLVGDRKENRPGEKVAIVASKVFNHLFFGSLKKYRSINIEVVAFGMIHATRHFQEKVRVIMSDEIQEIYNHN